MAVNWRGLIFGDDGTGFQVPTYAAVRAAFADYWRELKNVANLNTASGSQFGILTDAAAGVLDLAAQSARDGVVRFLFTFASGVALDEVVADITPRILATKSRAGVIVYGAPGATAPLATLVRTGPQAPAFATANAAVVPVAPAVLYVVEVVNFAAGAHSGQNFTVTVAGNPATFPAGPGDDAVAVRNGLVDAVDALLQSQAGHRAGVSPTTGRWALVVREEQGNGPFALAVAGPVGTMFAFAAESVTAEPLEAGPVVANAEALRYGPAFAGGQGYTNVEPAVTGRPRETDAQLKARHLVNQRGLGGGNPDAIKAILLAPTDLGGGGATFASVEYNPTDAVDDVGNKPHSVRAVVNSDADGSDVALALWKAKAAGDDTNGPEVVVILDAEGNNQTILIDRLQDLWIAADISVVAGEGWPNSGDPLAQIRDDVVAFVEGLGASKDVRVNDLPISVYPDGTPRGVADFVVRLGQSPTQGGPYVYNDYWPTPEPSADAASVPVSGRQKARCQVADVIVGP